MNRFIVAVAVWAAGQLPAWCQEKKDDSPKPAAEAPAPETPAAEKKEEPKKEEPKPEPPKKSELKYHGNDSRRPRPTTVTPPTATQAIPSDAIALFDGSDLRHWSAEKKAKDGSDEARWIVADGYFEIVPGSGGLRTREKFGSCQIHLEWRTPDVVKGSGQGRGNSGFDIQGHPEVQLLDSYNNDTYPDGQAAGIYGHLPPLVNASLPPGEWQTYDIIYMAPKFDDKNKKKMTHKPTYTVLHNGILVHHAVEVPGNAVECHFSLQDHGNPLRFRNVWVRRLRGYDEHPPSPEQLKN